MKLINFIYIKYSYSFFLSLFSSFFIFYIFSLIGNLGQNISFSIIILVSFINTLEIILSIPSFIVFLSIVLFLIILKSNNEIVIIKAYLNSRKIFLIFFPIVMIFTFIEMNKNNLTKMFIDIKQDYLGLNINTDTKIIINQENEEKSFLVLRGIKLGDSKIGEFQKYNIRKNKIENGSYSNQLELNNDNIIANNIISYEDDKIQKTNTQQIILDNFSKYYDKAIVYNNAKNQFRMNFSTMIKFINLILFFFCLFIIFFNKKYLDRKQNNSMPVLICFGLLIYSLIINSVKMSEYNFIFAIFTFIFFILIFIKFQKYE